MSLSDIVVHIARRVDWDHAHDAGVYVPPGFSEDGFIHMSRPERAQFPANAMYGRQADLVLLWIDTGRLTHRLVYEQADDAPMAFPHLYGQLNLDAVVGVSDLEPWESGDFVLPPQPFS